MQKEAEVSLETFVPKLVIMVMMMMMIIMIIIIIIIIIRCYGILTQPLRGQSIITLINII